MERIFFLLILFFNCIGLDLVFQNPKKPASNPEINFPKPKPMPEEKLEKKELFPQFPKSKPEFVLKKEISLEDERKVYQAFFTDDEKYFILITSFKIQKFSTDSQTLEASLSPRKITGGGFTGVAVFPDATRLVAGTSWEKKAYEYDWNGKRHTAYNCGKEYFYAEDVAVSESGEEVAVVCHNFAKSEKFIKLFTRGGKEINSFQSKELYLSNKKKWLVSFEEKTASVRNWKGEVITEFKSSTAITQIDSAENGLWLLGRIGNWELKKESMNSNTTLAFFQENSTTFNSDGWKPDQDYKNFIFYDKSGSYFITGGDKRACFWDFKGNCNYSLGGHNNYVSAVSVSSSGKYLLSASKEKAILWERDTINSSN
ncbi:MAG: WD40 repeat domain-containing protein [Leptospiraceae bacterium]|nr:WD40 repeat domain-containing protein [Leptospiraceae bacterium]